MTCSEQLKATALAVLLVSGCQSDEGPWPEVVDPRVLPVAGPLADPLAEISGMAWNGDQLLLLPQYPDRIGDFGEQALFGLPRHQIADVLHGRSTTPLEPAPRWAHACWLGDQTRGYQGREALAVAGDRYFMTIEVMNGHDMSARLVTGRLLPISISANLVLDRVTEIPMQVNLPAMSYETLVVDGERIIAIGEANGLHVNRSPRALVFDFELNLVDSLPMPQIEYRVTDATAIDEDRRFWVLNYFFPPEEWLLRPAPDPEVARFGAPDWLADGDPRVERLLELQITDDGRIVRTDSPPLWIRPRPGVACCNWEAVVRFGERGFLVMTDEFPETILAYVPLRAAFITP